MIAPWYVMAYTQLDRIAWRHGYALALHGSMARDLDLIAIPWTDDADDPEKLITAFSRFITKKDRVDYKVSRPEKKPHGRLAYVFPIGHDGHYIDLSIMPRLTKRAADGGVCTGQAAVSPPEDHTVKSSGSDNEPEPS